MNKVDYKTLNHKQKESYNYQKVSAVLAEYGYTTYRMHDDYQGADFHAVHIDGSVLKVQLKGRVAIEQKYLHKEIYIAFSYDRIKWYLYPHDEMYMVITEHSDGAKLNEGRSLPSLPRWLNHIMSKYEL